MRHPFIAGNWKMFKTVQDAVVYVKEFRSLREGPRGRGDRRRAAVHRRARRGRGRRGTPTSASPRRTSTGSARARSPAKCRRGRWCKEAGAEYVIIGHSERRTLFGETDQSVNRKIGAAIAAGLMPIVCIGETLEEREAERDAVACSIARSRQGFDGITRRAGRRARRRLRAGLGDRHGPNGATAEQAQEAHAHIRGRLRSGSVRRPPTSATSSTAAASSPTTSQRSASPSPTSTARSSAARASTFKSLLRNRLSIAVGPRWARAGRRCAPARASFRLAGPALRSGGAAARQGREQFSKAVRT